MDTIPDSFEAAAAEAAFALNQQDIPEELMEPSGMIMPSTAASLALGQVTNAQDQVGAGLLQCDICLTKVPFIYYVSMHLHSTKLNLTYFIFFTKTGFYFVKTKEFHFQHYILTKFS